MTAAVSAAVRRAVSQTSVSPGAPRCKGRSAAPSAPDDQAAIAALERRAAEPEREIAQRVGVGRRELRRVADEHEVLAQLPENRGHAAEADNQSEELPPADVRPAQRERDRTAQKRPVREVVRVTPPIDRVVEIERVADRVDQERQHEQRVDREEVRSAGARASPRSRAQERRRSSSRPDASRTPCRRNARDRRTRRR